MRNHSRMILMTSNVDLTKNTEKHFRKIPKFIGLKLARWIHAVNIQGVEDVRKISGYHDETLKEIGRDRGQLD